MDENSPQSNPARRDDRTWLWVFVSVFAVILLVALLLPKAATGDRGAKSSANDPPRAGEGNVARARSSAGAFGRWRGEPAATAEEIVARKLTQFGQGRRKLIHAIAKHYKVEVPADVEKFFDAVEGGKWDEIDATHEALLLTHTNLNQPKSAELHQIWRGIQETWGAAKETHNWPAQQLLDYGEAVLGSLRPGMIYVGGTDPGCFIPTFLNETSDGERHITLTQNALADGTYLDYLNFLYGDRLKTLTQDDSQHSFQDYVVDAQKRFQHDQQFPNEPKQLRPGEDFKMDGDRIQVGGSVAVMAINEQLLRTLMNKNPDAGFAIEQSFAFKSMYADTSLLGPIMELRAGDANPLTAERATQSMDYWRGTAQQLIQDSNTPSDSDARKAYAKLAAEQAALLLDRHYGEQAEQIFRLSAELCPTMPETIVGYVGLLNGQSRYDEAVAVVQNALQAAPTNREFLTLLNTVNAARKTDLSLPAAAQ